MISMITWMKNFLWENKVSIFIFLTIGTLTAILYFSLFTLLWKILNINYNIAISISYLGSIVFYFYCNRRFTFKSQSSIKQQIPRFIVLVIINYIITLLIVHSTVEILMLSPYIGVIFGIGATTAISYIVGKFWVFQLEN